MDKTTGNGKKEPSMSDIGAHVREDISQFREAAEKRQHELTDQVTQMVSEHPVASVAIAFGAGYILSGALLSRFTIRLATAGARWYLGRMLRDAIGGGVDFGTSSGTSSGRSSGGTSSGGNA